MAQIALTAMMLTGPATDTQQLDTLRQSAVEYALNFRGVPYSWGGDDAEGGFDCSGLVIEVLKSVGAFPRKMDETANSLYQRYSAHTVTTPYLGCLVFWGRSTERIRHVEIAISPWQSVGASGGGSKTKTRQDAVEQNAFVKTRPIYSGRGAAPVAIVDPMQEI